MFFSFLYIDFFISDFQDAKLRILCDTHKFTSIFFEYAVILPPANAFISLLNTHFFVRNRNILHNIQDKYAITSKISILAYPG